MILTKQYINSHRTAKGAFTRVQVEALGLKWTPPAGWVKRLVGTEISEDQAKNFEEGKSIKAKSVKAGADKAFNLSLGAIEGLTDERFKRLVKSVSDESERRAESGMS